MKLNDAMKHVNKIITQRLVPKTKTHYLGLEVEMLSPISEDLLALLIAKADLGDYVNLGNDSSIETDDGYDPEDVGLYGIEARICCKQKEYKDIIKRFFRVIKDAGCRVNESCGLHVHLDARQRNFQKMRHNLYCCQELLYSVLPHHRRCNDYCAPISPTEEALSIIPGNRRGINFHAYLKHKTIEIRMHHATMNTLDVIRWVDLLLTIITSPYITNGWEMLSSKKCPPILKSYVNNRTKHYGEWTYEKHINCHP